MARFRYSLQNVLNIKLKMETQAKQEFASARVALSEEEEKLERFLADKVRLEEEARRLLMGSLDRHDIEDNTLSRRFADQRIADQRISVKRATAVLEAARLRMTEAMQERKTYERLRERAFEEFMREENRAEGKVIDELTSYTYGQKSK